MFPILETVMCALLFSSEFAWNLRWVDVTAKETRRKHPLELWGFSFAREAGGNAGSSDWATLIASLEGKSSSSRSF